MGTRLILLAAISGVLPATLCAQSTPATPPPTTAPAAANPDALRLRSLQAVLDVRERQQDWHQAAQQAQAPIREDALKQQLAARLSGLAPRVAKELTAHPQDDALVSVAVYKQAAGDEKPAMVAVTFEGLGSELGGDYFSNVLAGEMKPPEAEGVPQGLVLDPQSSSYLIFFMGKNGLEGGDIPLEKMKQSVVAAINHQRDLASRQAQHEFEQQQRQANADQAAALRQQQALDQAQQAASVQQQTIPEYPDINNGYNDGYYYPGIGVPIVITPNGFANNSEWFARERRREESLEKRYARRSQRNASTGQPANTTGNAETLPRPAGVVNPPGQAGVVVPPGQAGVQTPAGSQGVRTPAGSQGVQTPAGSQGVRTGAGQGTPTQQQPAPPPAGRQAPAQQAPASSSGRK